MLFWVEWYLNNEFLLLAIYFIHRGCILNSIDASFLSFLQVWLIKNICFDRINFRVVLVEWTFLFNCWIKWYLIAWRNYIKQERLKDWASKIYFFMFRYFSFNLARIQFKSNVSTIIVIICKHWMIQKCCLEFECSFEFKNIEKSKVFI